MRYISTRGNVQPIEASAAILKGIADDGGLFIPEAIPKMDRELKDLLELNYQQLAYEVLKLYLTDYTQEELTDCIFKAYDQKFDSTEITPLVKTADTYFLELFHGKTLAFKDMALSILPHLMKKAAKKHSLENEIVILAATSGDTGKAALEGFKDVDGTKIIVFYPENGVSPLQKQQMITQEGNNTFVVGIKGNFDDAQKAVKTIFTDVVLKEELKKGGYVFSSANSINIGRLVPQIVYYFYAYLELVRKGDIETGESVNFVVPTGNFGNILAGYYAKNMGLPVEKLICASNENKVLCDFFKTGEYDANREFVQTISPSMDILISSNLERLLYNTVKDPVCIERLMKNLSGKGKYTLDEEFPDFISYFANEEETKKAIKNMFENFGYIMDTHTAVAYAAYLKYKVDSKEYNSKKTIIISTASPYKFTKAVLEAIDSSYKDRDDFELLEEMTKFLEMPDQIVGLQSKDIIHSAVVDVFEIKDCVLQILS